MNRSVRVGSMLAGVLLVLAGAGWGWVKYGKAGDDVLLRTVPAERSDLAATIAATGTIEPEEVIDVGAQVAAQIKFLGQDPENTSKSIDYGSIVHPNTLLAQLDDALFKARVEQCQAAVDEVDAQIFQADANIKRAEADRQQYAAKLDQAERDWMRAVQLKPSRAISDSEYDLARSNYDSAKAYLAVGDAALVQVQAAKLQTEKSKGKAQAGLREAQVNLSYTQIRSPVEGVIVDRRVNVGQTVVAGLNAPSLFLIAKDLKRLQVWASVNEADIGNIRAGQPVRFTVDAFPRETFRGEVSQIRLNAMMTNNVVTYTVVVTTDNKDGRLKPYMTANLQFEIDRRTNVMLVPNAALRWKPKANQILPEAKAEAASLKNKVSPKDGIERGIVWVAEEGMVRPVQVQLGLTDGVQTEIVAGELQVNEPVVIGSRRLTKSEDATANPFAPKMFGAKKGG